MAMEQATVEEPAAKPSRVRRAMEKVKAGFTAVGRTKVSYF